ncbi:hypothetical protein GCM10009718_08930 [Isoptericola halotolerans]|uniref:Lipoprotein n=1 Tax=Isoptericola halotolerans TaxID=300560 RepID=A0ABX2A062_9MICO|nr:hypothetical protein [Isoptericola halotolerans]NOV96184.1 hypothetical protein [Isoptericola halotolerans]
MHHIRSRRRLAAALTALVVAPSLAACSFEVGEIEKVGEDAETSESTETEEPATDEPDAAGDEGAADAGQADEGAEAAGDAPVSATELATIHAEHVAARVPANWESLGDADGWSYVHQLSNAEGGVAGRIGFMPGGAEMTADGAVDWFISQVEGQGVTDENYAPVTTLRDDEGRANTSYTYDSGGQKYVAVVWALVDGNGIPSLVQLSGSQEVVTQDLVATIDQNLNLNGDWQGTAG